MILGVCALVVSVVSAGFTGLSIKYVRSAAKASIDAAGSAAITAGHDSDRRHAELTPRFRITVEPANPGIDTLKMVIYLRGPAELERLDQLTVSIRDDNPWRSEGTPPAAGRPLSKSRRRSGAGGSSATAPGQAQALTARRVRTRRAGRRRRAGCLLARNCRSSSTSLHRRCGRTSRCRPSSSRWGQSCVCGWSASGTVTSRGCSRPRWRLAFMAWKASASLTCLRHSPSEGLGAGPGHFPGWIIRC